MRPLLALLLGLHLRAHAAAPKAETPAPPQITIVYPREGTSMSMAPGEVILGWVRHPKAPFKINGMPVKPHPDGGFIAFPPVSPGSFTFLCQLELPGGGSTAAARSILVAPPLTPTPPGPARIDAEARLPASDLELAPGDWLTAQMKGTQGGTAQFSIGGGKPLPMVEANPGLGIYQGFYQIRDGDRFEGAEIRFSLKTQKGWGVSEKAKGKVTVRHTPSVAVVKSSGIVNVKTAPGEGYFLFPLPGTRVTVTGRQGTESRLRLSPVLSGWVDTSSLRLLPEGTAPPRAVLGTIRTEPDPDGAALRLNLTENVPFDVEENSDLSGFTLRLYNTVGHTNWVVYDPKDSLIRQVRWRQQDSETVELSVSFAPNQRLWGYHASWEGKTLRLDLRRPPPIAANALKNRVIVIDPGHMPSAHGAVGPRELLEKDANLDIAKALFRMLEAEGAVPVITRQGDEEVSLLRRPEYAWEKKGDIFISVHNNAIGDGENPFERPRGFETYYYNPRSFELARRVHAAYRKHIDLPDGGLRYSNYLVTRITEMPAILTESAYIILPEQEALLRKPEFQKKVARAMLEGIRQFLEAERSRQEGAQAAKTAAPSARAPAPKKKL